MTAALSFAEARNIAASVPALAPVRLPLAEGVGCVLAEVMTAQLDIPHAATSAMDGWAVTSSEQPEWKLRDDGAESPGTLLAPLTAGEAVAVVTGSPVPAGTRSVLRSEHGHVRHPQGEHSATQAPMLRAVPDTQDLEQDRNIRPAAAEARTGQTLSEPGSLLTASRAAAAAVAGYDDLTLVPRPQVDLILTGGEVITSGLPAPGQVRDVFGLAIPAMLDSLGAETADSHRLDDDAAALVGLISRSDSDLIITTGGTAASPADALRPALAHLGADILVDSVQMRPGHPALLARHRGTYVLGLPGNPLAGFAALTALGGPLIRALGGVAPALVSHTLMAGSTLQGPRSGIRLVPVRVHQSTVHPLPHASSHMMRGLAEADALAVVPAGEVAEDEQVECLAVPGSSADFRSSTHRSIRRP